MARNSKYSNLIGLLEKKLNSMAIGDVMPSEQALADEYQVCKPTVRRALAELAANGLIVKKNGIGSVVAGSVRVIPRELIFLCHDIVFFHESLKSFSIHAANSNYLSTIIPLYGDLATQERIISTAIARKPAGIVLYADTRSDAAAGYQALADSGIPLLYLIRTPNGLDGNLLTFENEDGIVAIVKRFYEQGCRKFALFGDIQVNPLAAAERTHGFHSAMKKLRLLPREEWICSTPEQQAQFIENFRDPKRRPDAVICLNDYCAGNLYRLLTKAGINTDGLKISGFDRSPMTAFIPFELLTVEPPMAALGEVAAQMLIRQIENPAFGHATRKLASRLVEINQN